MSSRHERNRIFSGSTAPNQKMLSGDWNEAYHPWTNGLVARTVTVC